MVLPTVTAQANLISFDELNNDSIPYHEPLAAREIIKKSQEKTKYNTQENVQIGVLDKLSNIAANSVRNFTQTGAASWYGRQFHGKKTASGDVFDMHKFTAAHKTLPLNCLIRVTNKQNGKSIVVKVNDRGPFSSNRILDLSYGAAKQLGMTEGIAKVNIERISD